MSDVMPPMCVCLVNDNVCLSAISECACWWHCFGFHGDGFLPVVLVGCSMVDAVCCLLVIHVMVSLLESTVGV